MQKCLMVMHNCHTICKRNYKITIMLSVGHAGKFGVEPVWPWEATINRIMSSVHSTQLAELFFTSYLLTQLSVISSHPTSSCSSEDWSVEQGLTSHSTQFRSFFYRSDDPTNSVKALKEGG